MTGRSNPITVYVTDERKAHLQRRAEAQDDSISGLVNDMIDRHLQEEAQGSVAAETRAEERIQELITLGVEEITDAAQDLRDLQAKTGAYAIASFELQKRDYSDYVRNEALTTGAKRIHRDPEDVQTADPGILAVEAMAADRGVDADADGGNGNGDGDRDDDSGGPPPATGPDPTPDPDAPRSGDPTPDGEVEGGRHDDREVSHDGDDHEGDDDARDRDTDLFDRLRSNRE